MPTTQRSPDPPSTADRVLDAALVSFAARGFDATSLDGLAAELGIRKQTILYYHRSKEVLLGAVIDRAVGELVDAFDVATTTAPVHVERPAIVIDTILRLGAGRPELLALLWQVARRGAASSGRLAEGVQPLFEQLVTYLCGPGRASGATRRRIGIAVRAVAARVLGLAVEVEMRRALGITADLAWLRHRRSDLLRELRAL